MNRMCFVFQVHPNGFNNSPVQGFNNAPVQGFNNAPVQGFNNAPTTGFNNEPEIVINQEPRNARLVRKSYFVCQIVEQKLIIDTRLFGLSCSLKIYRGCWL